MLLFGLLRAESEVIDQVTYSLLVLPKNLDHQIQKVLCCLLCCLMHQDEDDTKEKLKFGTFFLFLSSDLLPKRLCCTAQTNKLASLFLYLKRKLFEIISLHMSQLHASLNP